MVGTVELTCKTVVGGRTGDEVIPDHVQGVSGGGMSATQSRFAPIIDDVINILDSALGLGVSAFVTHPQVVAKSNIVYTVDERTETLRMDAFGHETILNSDIVAIDGYAQVVPPAPFDRAVIDNDIKAMIHAQGFSSAVPRDSRKRR